MKSVKTIVQQNFAKKVLFGLFLLTALAQSSDLLAQRVGGIKNPGGGQAGEWISGDGKIYTTAPRVGIGTSTPATLLHLQGIDSEYLRVTSFGGVSFSNAAAGIELERKLDQGTILKWDIVNQDAFKIRRNATTLFLMDNNEAQFGTEADDITLNVLGRDTYEGFNDGKLYGGAIRLRSGTNEMRIDGDQIEAEDDLGINLISGSDVKINTDDSEAKLNVGGAGYQLKLINNANSWRIGATTNDWAVGSDKLVITPTSSSTDAAIVINKNGNVGIGKTSPGKALDVDGTTRTTVLEITGGADLAEPFEVAGESTIEAGTVVAIDPANAGQLKVASAAYDKTVAGIISGAGNINPGMVMGQDGSIASGEHPVALTGRVYAKVDASYGAIQPGDLLTTSNTPGHAMKVSDANQAQGAIIGKAMTALEEGPGLVLVLVSLQ